MLDVMCQLYLNKAGKTHEVIVSALYNFYSLGPNFVSFSMPYSSLLNSQSSVLPEYFTNMLE